MRTTLNFNYKYIINRSSVRSLQCRGFSLQLNQILPRLGSNGWTALYGHSSLGNISGMKKSASWRAPISLKLLCRCQRARKHFLRQRNSVFSLVRLIMWLLRTNKSTILIWRRKYIWALGNTIFLLARLIMWMLRTNQSTELLWRRNFFLLSNSYIGVLVISVHVNNFNMPISSCLNYI